ncbi:MAG: flavodoxin family protein [Candidatus Freyarchaeum deiterrae]
MKILITYYSLTGNTEKIAKVIYDEISKKHRTDIKKIEQITPDTLYKYDLVFLGTPCYNGDLAGPVKKNLNSLHNSPKFKLAGFFTHYSPLWSKEECDKCGASLQNISKQKQIDYKGTFDSQGFPTFSPEYAEKIKQTRKMSEEEFEKIVEEARKHPSPEDEEKAREFAQIVLTKK